MKTFDCDGNYTSFRKKIFAHKFDVVSFKIKFIIVRSHSN